jgi:hypothetical protein
MSSFTSPEDLFFDYCFEGSLEKLQYLKETSVGIKQQYQINIY